MAGVGAVRGQRQNGNSGPRAVLAPDIKTVRASANLDAVLYVKLRTAADAAGLTLSAYICTLVERDVTSAAAAVGWSRDASIRAA